MPNLKTLQRFIKVMPRLPIAYMQLRKAVVDLAAHTDLFYLHDRPDCAQSFANTGESLLNSANRWHEAVRIAARFVAPKVECLPKAVALSRILRQRQMPAVLKLGVAKSESRLLSHAWIEIGGIAIGESTHTLARYRPIDADDWLPIYSNNNVAKPSTEK